MMTDDLSNCDAGRAIWLPGHPRCFYENHQNTALRFRRASKATGRNPFMMQECLKGSSSIGARGTARAKAV